MIAHQDLYLHYIAASGVGSNDTVADSQKSYISYLNSVSRLLGVDVSPRLLSTEEDVAEVASQLKGKAADKSISNYRSAMRQYVAMVQTEGLAG